MQRIKKTLLSYYKFLNEYESAIRHALQEIPNFIEKSPTCLTQSFDNHDCRSRDMIIKL